MKTLKIEYQRRKRGSEKNKCRNGGIDTDLLILYYKNIKTE